MESEAKYTFVGAVVVLVFVALIAAILWMSTDLGKKEMQKYIVYFKENSLSGLEKDGIVTMKGVKVGTIAELSIFPEDIEKVKVVLEVEEGTPVRQNTEAAINRNFLTGIASIDLIHGTQKSPPLELTPPGEDAPVLKESISELQAVTNSLSETLQAIRDGANAVKLQSSRLGDDFHEMSKAISHTAEKLENPSALLNGPKKSDLGPGEEKIVK